MKQTTITQEQLRQAREVNPDDRVEIAIVEMDIDGTETDVLIKAPGRDVLNEYEKWEPNNPNKGRSILIRNCVIDEDVKKETERNNHLFYALPKAILTLIPTSKARIKNF